MRVSDTIELTTNESVNNIRAAHRDVSIRVACNIEHLCLYVFGGIAEAHRSLKAMGSPYNISRTYLYYLRTGKRTIYSLSFPIAMAELFRSLGLSVTWVDLCSLDLSVVFPVTKHRKTKKGSFSRP